MLNRVRDQVSWNAVRGGEDFELKPVEGLGSGMTARAVALSARHPAYAGGMAQSDDAVLGLIVKSSAGKTMGFFPQLPRLTDELARIFSALDCLLLDGTFWSDDELMRLQGSGERAREMGHIPVGGKDGTLGLLSSLTHPRKLYIHINNTNPMLNEAGAEYREMRDAGWELAEDGCHFNL
jgi:pyrroloquinoline quinone biosynthesis protein B